jgi:hypothetical protein
MKTAAFSQQPERFRSNKDARFIIEATGRGPITSEGVKFLLKRDGVSQPDQSFGLRPRGRADIDPEILYPRPLRLFSGVLEVEGSTPDDARNPLLAVHPDPLPDGRHVIMSTDPAEMEQAVLTNEVDHESNLIDVPGQHDPDRRVRIKRGDNVAAHIGRDAVSKTLRVFTIDPCCGLLIAARGGRVRQRSENV